MTVLTYILAAMSTPRPNGTHAVHMYIKREEPTYTESPGEEHRALKDAEEILRDIVNGNAKGKNGIGEDSLLQEGEMPNDAIPLFAFAIGVSWNRVAKISHYSRIDYRQVLIGRDWVTIATCGMELYDYTMRVIRSRENGLLKAKGLNRYVDSRESLEEARRRFAEYADTVLAKQIKSVSEIEYGKKMAACPNRVNGYCSPMQPKCPCYWEGRCVNPESATGKPAISTGVKPIDGKIQIGSIVL